MGSCPLFSCLNPPKSRPTAEADTNSEKEEDSIASKWTAAKDASRSSSSDLSSDAECHLIRSDSVSVHSEQVRSGSSRKKPKREDYHSADTLSELKQGKNSHNFSKGPFRISTLKPFAEKTASSTDTKESNLEKQKDSLMISEWGDCFEDEDIRLSDASNLMRPYEDNWSECTFTHTSVFGRFESSIVANATVPKMKMLVSPGMVWAMLRSKAGATFQLLKLSSSLQEVVDNFLKAETGLSLPISFTFLNNTLPKLLPFEKMGTTLSENLDGHLDEKSQGLAFFVGSVNRKLCFKMIIGDLEQFQMLFSKPRK